MAHPRTEVRCDQPPSFTRDRIGGAGRAPRTCRFDPKDSPSPARLTAARRLSVVAALLIVTGGYVHFCLYRHGYRFIPKIGDSFLLQFTVSAVLACALLVKGRQLRIGRRSLATGQLIRLSSIGLSL